MLETATLDDIVAVGGAELAIRDATVVDKLIHPQLNDVIDHVASMIETGPAAVSRKKLYDSHTSFFEDMVDAYTELFPHVTTRELGEPYNELRLTHPFHLSKGEERGLEWHYDKPWAGMLSAAFNATFYTRTPGWEWLVASALQEEVPEDIASNIQMARVPLKVGGLVIMGEWARVTSEGAPCSASHKVEAPEIDKVGLWLPTRVSELVY
jgi:hypothetical protein